nr:hypothetical protein Iba_chr01dCG3860 [Ipomoea batatas]
MLVPGLLTVIGTPRVHVGCNVCANYLGHTAHCVMAQCSGSGRALCMLVIMFVPGLLTVLGTPRVHVGYNVYATLVKYVLSCYVFIPAQIMVALRDTPPDYVHTGHRSPEIMAAHQGVSPDYVMNISSGSTKYWTPECEEVDEAWVGQRFSSFGKQALNSTSMIDVMYNGVHWGYNMDVPYYAESVSTENQDGFIHFSVHLH